MTFPMDTSLPVPLRPNRVSIRSSNNTPIELINTRSKKDTRTPSYTHGLRLNKSPELVDLGQPLKKFGLRKTVDYNSSALLMLKNRIWQRDYRDRPFLQPDNLYTPQLLPPQCYVDNYASSITTALVKTVSNKVRCSVVCVAWTPHGRRLISGASSGKLTLWNGLTFNFESIIPAHNSSIRSMVYSHNGKWVTTGEHNGFIKYWQPNMINVAMIEAHNKPISGISFCPSDEKFATCSDDGTIVIWDFLTKKYENQFTSFDVNCIDWHPFKSVLISGSKDVQQSITLWDPKTGKSSLTLHGHTNTIMDIKWNANGNWVLSSSRDCLVKLYDIRKFSYEVQTFKGHKKEVSSIAWHPFHENLFCSGDSNGDILFWNEGIDNYIASLHRAHSSFVWALAWNPLGEVLCSGSNDSTCKFWTRNRPGDNMISKHHSINKVSSILKTEKEKDSDKSLFNRCSTIPFLDDAPTCSISSTAEEKSVKPITQTRPILDDFKKLWCGKNNDVYT